LEFDGRFFFFAMILPFAAEMFQGFVNMWFYYLFPTISTSLLPWIGFAFAPLSLGLSVFLPFGVMYILSTRVTETQHYRAIIISIFLGCWIGEAAASLLNTFIMYQLGGSYGTDTLLASVYILWGTLTSALSPSVFISLAATLLAYYNKTSQPTQPSQSIQI
jgi:hypothetical protein